MDKRRGRVKWGPSGTRSRTTDAYWKQPLKWNREAMDYRLRGCHGCGEEIYPHRVVGRLCCPGCQATALSEPIADDIDPTRRPRVFCASLADVFEHWSGPIVDHRGYQLLLCCACDTKYATQDYDGVNCCPKCETGRYCRALTMDDLRSDLFKLIDATPNLDWQLLTKRPENIRRMWSPTPGVSPQHPSDIYDEAIGIPYRHNCWLGTSVSNQETANKQIPELLKCRDLASKLFVSAEPLLGPVDCRPGAYGTFLDHDTKGENDPDLWIFGGESGPKARPCDVGWIRSGVRQCQSSGTAAFVKQLGSFAVDGTGHKGTVPVEHYPPLYLNHKKGGNPSEWPEGLRIQEFPA